MASDIGSKTLYNLIDLEDFASKEKVSERVLEIGSDTNAIKDMYLEKVRNPDNSIEDIVALKEQEFKYTSRVLMAIKMFSNDFLTKKYDELLDKSSQEAKIFELDLLSANMRGDINSLINELKEPEPQVVDKVELKPTKQKVINVEAPSSGGGGNSYIQVTTEQIAFSDLRGKDLEEHMKREGVIDLDEPEGIPVLRDEVGKSPDSPELKYTEEKGQDSWGKRRNSDFDNEVEEIVIMPASKIGSNKNPLELSPLEERLSSLIKKPRNLTNYDADEILEMASKEGRIHEAPLDASLNVKNNLVGRLMESSKGDISLKENAAANAPARNAFEKNREARQKTPIGGGIDELIEASEKEDFGKFKIPDIRKKKRGAGTLKGMVVALVISIAAVVNMIASKENTEKTGRAETTEQNVDSIKIFKGKETPNLTAKPAKDKEPPSKARNISKSSSHIEVAAGAKKSDDVSQTR